MAASKSVSAPKNAESMAVIRSCKSVRSMFCRTVLMDVAYSCPSDSTVCRSGSAIVVGATFVRTSKLRPSHIVSILHGRNVHGWRAIFVHVVQDGVAYNANYL